MRRKEQRRQYDAVEPENRLVARSLERVCGKRSFARDCHDSSPAPVRLDHETPSVDGRERQPTEIRDVVYGQSRATRLEMLRLRQVPEVKHWRSQIVLHAGA